MHRRGRLHGEGLPLNKAEHIFVINLEEVLGNWLCIFNLELSQPSTATHYLLNESVGGLCREREAYNL